ncbi:O-antigen ligase family protein [Halioxenophilus sp. WMMB6]|uniref:O-antigen ligase family protein n=1 Tax=Halioxenophilus sp. WMMB6 TaxID=3073815 RepID=UPI00295EE299|nr:O-antigen ligase family protein [Halioxenophilus sp. WMMB6]
MTLVYATVPVIMVAYLLHLFYKMEEVSVWLKCWLIIVAVATLTGSMWLIYLAIIFVGMNLIPKDRDSRIFYFIALLCTLPKLPFQIPFPGINYIVTMEFQVATSLVLLLPIYIQLWREGVTKSLLDKLVFVFVFYCMVMDFRNDTSITQTMRGVVIYFLTQWLLYWPIANNRGDLKKFLQGFFLVGTALAFEAIVEWGVVWKTYVTIIQHIDAVTIPRNQMAYYFRGLGLRISSSWLGPIPFGMFMSSIAVIAVYMHQIGFRKHWTRFGFAGAALAATLFTDSRGALLVFIVSMYASLYFLKANKGWKTTFKVLTVLGVIVVLTNLDTFYKIDTSGTFQYRADLITYSMDAFHSAPIFGDVHFRENPVLIANMTQGQGIVDIVNHYLKVLLQYGLIGLGLYVTIWIVTIASVAKRASLLQSLGDDRYQAGALLVSLLVGIAVVIYTTSLMGYLQEYIFILMALASAYLKNTADVTSAAGAPSGAQPHMKTAG